MVLGKIGISLPKRAAAWLKASGKTNIVETKSVVFHGVNPSLTYEPAGKTFALPRYISEEMQQARKMNKTTLKQIKTPGVQQFPKATADDLVRLTSETMEDSFSRVKWTNPSDGKSYYLLKQGEDESGNVLIKILDNEGAFVKEDSLKPKTIAVIDEFRNNNDHGDLVQIYLKRHNPFVKILTLNTAGVVRTSKMNSEKIMESLKQLQINRPDYLSMSFGSTSKEKILSDRFKKELEILNDLNKRGTRIFRAAGNEGASAISYDIKGPIEGVGALDNTGRIADYSSSRNSLYTQHYELGNFPRKEVFINGELAGYNITGTSGVDIPMSAVKDSYNQQKALLKRLENLSNEKSELKLASDQLKEKMKKESGQLIREDYDFSDAIKMVETKYQAERDLLKKIDSELYTLDIYAETLIPELKNLKMDDIIEKSIQGTSFSTPTRTAKVALNDMMKGII